jgi:hypothetical protein
VTPPGGSSRSARFLPAGIAFGVLLIAAAVSIYLTLFKGPADLAQATAAGIKEVFNITPRVMIDETVVIEEMAPIAELAVVERPMLVDYRWAHTWMGSTKTLHLQGTFVAKAGFDLREPWTIRIARESREVTAVLPKPRLLSLEMSGYRVLEDHSGWWNRISAGDREAAVLQLSETARRQALSAGILVDAQRTAKARIAEILERNGASAEFLQRSDGADEE